jgi:isocitrate dehydrogenase kinase/phosphatase
MTPAEIADLIFTAFDGYSRRFREIPGLAKRAFEQRDWTASVALSRERIRVYANYARRAAEDIRAQHSDAADDEALWAEIRDLYVEMIRGRYAADIAYAFMNSTRRMISMGQWRAVDYSYGQASGERRPAPEDRARIFTRIPFAGEVTPEIVERIFDIPGLDAPFLDRARDAARVASRINNRVGGRNPDGFEGAFEIVEAGFYRNRGAYIVGRIRLTDSVVPLAIALLNDDDGVYVDAVLLSPETLHYVFSTTLANFHVTLAHYHELADFLHEIIPARAHPMQYSTIGYHHTGKVAVMGAIDSHFRETGERFDHAVGPRGTVAIAFSAPSSRLVLKVIRDHPTENYKWGEFAGIPHVMGKYRQVHEINRSGSMLDNVIYSNVTLPRSYFDANVLETLLEYAGENVALRGSDMLFKHLIVQIKLTPLPVFLATASQEDAERAISSLGRCIKNNAAANIFNKDLDGRNYGVGYSQKVYLFDYDAVEPLTDIKVRTNADRIDGDEEVPDWFFEEGTVFLPEEIELHLRIEDPPLRRVFREKHGEILSVEYWERMQRAHWDGRIPTIETYPDECRLT